MTGFRVTITWRLAEIEQRPPQPGDGARLAQLRAELPGLAGSVPVETLRAIEGRIEAAERAAMADMSAQACYNKGAEAALATPPRQGRNLITAGRGDSSIALLSPPPASAHDGGILLFSPDDYETFKAARAAQQPDAGFAVDPQNLHPSHFPFQRAAITMALRRGRAALFEDTGLGKSRQILEWMRQVASHTGGRCLLIVPLAVAHQFVHTEAPAISAELVYARNQAEADASGCSLIVTNYDRAGAFDPSQYAGVALDEADIIANFVGKTTQLLTAMFAHTPYRLVATATPAPNDLISMGRYAEFLGIMDSGMMLTRYFIRDSQSAATLRLRHWAAAGPFWDWLVSWAVCIGLPSDLGDYSDEGYILPPLDVQQHMVSVDYGAAQSQGYLFPGASPSATRLWATKKETFRERCMIAAALVAQKPNDPWVVWCSTDDESKLLARLIPGAVEVRGSHKPEEKERRLSAFSSGESRVIVTKPEIAGMGLNWQHAADMVYCSPTFSFKHFYQGLRRIYRFRQRRPVTCHVVVAETEESVIAAVQRKQALHREMHTQARLAMRRQRLLAEDWRVTEGALQSLELPAWMRSAV